SVIKDDHEMIRTNRAHRIAGYLKSYVFLDPREAGDGVERAAIVGHAARPITAARDRGRDVALPDSAQRESPGRLVHVNTSLTLLKERVVERMHDRDPRIGVVLDSALGPTDPDVLDLGIG